MKIGGRKLRNSRGDKRFFRRTAIKRTSRNLVARGGCYN